MSVRQRPTEQSPHRTDELRQDLALKLFSALLVLIMAALLLMLPPIVNDQLEAAVDLLRQPVAEVVAAAALLAFAAWRYRYALGIALVLLLLGAAQMTYFIATTADGRGITSQAKAWREVRATTTESGRRENEPNENGRAYLEWSGSAVTLRLRSERGTTQQGFNLAAGNPGRPYLFSARLTGWDGRLTSSCPLLFGIESIRSYYTFRLERQADHSHQAAAYRILPITEQKWGFRAATLDQADDLPYVWHWNIIRQWEGSEVKLAIYFDGTEYHFFVNDRQVFHRRIDDSPPQRVAVGATTLGVEAGDPPGHGEPEDVICHFSHVELRVQD
ncbi:hypothetical protein ACH495_17190 [Micromonospora sp. NPDC018662]|uniref:hypothetical protein n=1 Tax=Micromonospora sp. NPDC018662 TaxID=3364238 RepID=UPI0037B6EBE3